MRDIVRSEVGRSLSPGFGSIRILPRRRARAPLWLVPVLGLGFVVLIGVMIAAH